MEFIKYPPDRLYRRFTPKPVLYHCSFFDMLNPYMNTKPLYEYIDGSDPNRLRNLLNYISNTWEKTKNALQESDVFLKSNYRSLVLSRIDMPISHQDWDDRINDFIHNDICIAFFVVKCIMSYVFPD